MEEIVGSNTGMTLNEYQLKAHETRDMTKTRRVLYPALGSAGEAGEICDKVKKIIRDTGFDVENPDEWTDELRKSIALELGDELWYVAELAYDLGYTLEDIAMMNNFKLKSRKERDKLNGSGDYR